MSDMMQHEIDPQDCDERDEIDGDQQLALVWCQTHQKYEWHWVLRAHLGPSDDPTLGQ